MKNYNVSTIAKRFWKPIALAVVSVGTLLAVTIGISIDFIHIGDVNIHTSVSQVDNTGNGTGPSQPNPASIDQAIIQLEDLEPCTTYEFQASLDPDFNDAETITFTTKCEESNQ